MTFMQWSCFSWELSKLPEEAPALEPQYQIRRADKSEYEIVREAALRGFKLDSSWSDVFNQLRPRLEVAMEEVLNSDEGAGIVVTHGTRVIAASVIRLTPDADNHLTTGPSVLVEYRSRGIGTALLYHSLTTLRDVGLERAVGKTRRNGQAAKHIYSKFGSTMVLSESESLLVKI